MKILLFCLLISSAYSKPITREFGTRGLFALIVYIGKGQVNVSGTADGKLVVKAEPKGFDEKKCVFRVENKKGQIAVVVEKRKKFFNSSDCEMDIDVKVPKSFTVSTRVGFGDTHIKKVSGMVDFNIGRGNINIDADTETLNGKVGSGSVEAKGLTGDVNLNIGTGNSELVYNKNAKRGELNIKTGTGNVNLSLPAKAKVSSDFKSGVGSVSSDFQNTKDASFKVVMKSGVGSLKISKM